VLAGRSTSTPTTSARWPVRTAAWASSSTRTLILHAEEHRGCAICEFSEPGLFYLAHGRCVSAQPPLPRPLPPDVLRRVPDRRAAELQEDDLACDGRVHGWREVLRIVACLCWFDEPLPFLDRLVRSLGGHVDALVAADGPWNGYEGDVTSPREQRDTIRAAAAEAALPTRIVVPTKRWGSQIEKRTFVARTAIDEHHASWLFVVDGDSELTRCDDDALRQSLALTDRDVASVTMRYLNRSWPYSEMPPHEVTQRHIYRGIPGLTYRYVHNGIVTPDGRWLNGDGSLVSLAETLDLSRIVTVDHDNQNRGRDRNLRMRAYRKTREEKQLEVWQR
jgi:hypothetical protein